MTPLIVAFAASILFTPLAIPLAMKLQMVDRPNRGLKTHRKPIPYLGGVAVFISLCLPLLILHGELLMVREHASLMLGAAIVLLGGVIDDRYELRPLGKLLFQCAAVVPIWTSGMRAGLLDSALWDGLLSCLWMIAIINAFNLIDIMDGLSATVAAIAALFLSILFDVQGDAWFGAIMLSLLGACGGFLLYNFHPARIFLGDAGSQLIGYLLAAAALNWASHEPISLGGHHIFVPALIFAIPLGETLFISILRLKAKRSPFQGSKDHFAQRMVKQGFSIPMTVALTALFAATLDVLAMIALYYTAAAPYCIGLALLLLMTTAYKLGRIDMKTE
ncbi:undecaprenyl/decaprenyl-phosphate alpha-N-acetylglucosaminyl 1-phosphate transferase [Paenibacillus sp. J5C_2022]|uniref:glycosyltransferase family 4 protein n=1 Tax=Paenibacillus sp. J5C2022 TaxID=2977129 RepID=UPI0021D33349|nr:MraY family glycosyltransferase [Paenibacillus sp. J5C2022]MCU6709585.1 undecaprenyl/decaprenyl-phosphate alpha-N-acetylglucosaminyl 1-phosphate transferase [Paenibacillus sp. J5C2022]